SNSTSCRDPHVWECVSGVDLSAPRAGHGQRSSSCPQLRPWRSPSLCPRHLAPVTRSPSETVSRFGGTVRKRLSARESAYPGTTAETPPDGYTTKYAGRSWPSCAEERPQRPSPPKPNPEQSVSRQNQCGEVPVRQPVST